MKLATTFILLALVVGSFFYIRLHEKNTLSTGEILARQGEVCSFDPSDAESITVKGPGGVLVVRRDAQGTWMIEEPYMDRVDPDWVGGLLKSASKLQKMATIGKGEASQGLEKYGLGDDKFDLEVQFGEGGNLKLEVGSAAPISRSVTIPDPRGGAEKVSIIDTTYIMDPEGSGDVLVVDGDLHPLLSRPLAELRDPRLMRLDGARLVAMSLKNDLGEMEVSRTDAGEWELVRPLKARGHIQNIRLLLSQLNSTEVSNGGLQTNSVDQRAFEDGNKTVVNITSVDAEGNRLEPLQLEVSKPIEDEELVLARISDRKPVFKLDAAIYELLDRSPNDLRDDHLAFVDPNEIDRIQITKTTQQPTEVWRTGEIWRLDRFGKAEFASPRAIQNFFKRLNEEKIIEFMADSAADLKRFGLDRPYLQIALTKRPEEPSAGDPDVDASAESDAETKEPEKVVLRIGVSPVDEEVYANYVGEPFVYKINEGLTQIRIEDPLYWKALRVLALPRITAIKKIFYLRGTNPMITVKCDFGHSRFSAEMAGEDVTEQLNKRQLQELGLALAGLRAERWVTAIPSEIDELEDPSLILRFEVEAPDPEGGTQMIPVELRLAPTAKGRITQFFYGKLNSSPDVFLISLDTYAKLAAPILMPKGGDPSEAGSAETDPDALIEALRRAGRDSQPDVPGPGIEPTEPGELPKPQPIDSDGPEQPETGAPENSEGEENSPPTEPVPSESEADETAGEESTAQPNPEPESGGAVN